MQCKVKHEPTYSSRWMKHKMAKATTKQQLWAKTEEHSGVKAKLYITNETTIFV